ncbi:MAG: ribosome small subunit-dependent GTPase A [Pseudomonadota bacterium]
MGILSTADRSQLARLGWKPVFQQQLAEHAAHLIPLRVIAVQRTGLTVTPLDGEVQEVAMGGKWFTRAVEERPTVGDWVLLDPHTQAVEQVLARTSEIKRMSPGGVGDLQMIAANIDTAFVVTSCNSDFSIARIERYLAVLLEAAIQPVVVLTKVDLLESPDDLDTYRDALRDMAADVPVECVNALQPETLLGLAAWCHAGQTIALLGSSGVGKSTLVNSLAGEQLQPTQAIRSDDDKGRHTTTHRSLHLLPQGGVILDSPGMREFQLADAQSGVSEVFADIEDLARQCRFSDCAHTGEPGCAVAQAIAAGTLEARRLESFFKLQREAVYSSETVAQRHIRVRQFSKKVKAASTRRKQR